MFSTLEKRKEYINNMESSLKNMFPQSNYQVWVFGSFLTQDFKENSDIDISIYSDDIDTALEIRDYLKEYFSKDSLDSDIVIFEFNKRHFINIPIIVHGKALTEYEPPNWLGYIKEMIQIWGINPTGKEIA